MDLRRYEILSFDCYGTLIDWDAGLVAQLKRISTDVDDDQILQRYAVFEAEIEQDHPTMLYSDVVTEAARMLARSLDRDVPEALVADIGASVGQWPPFPDSVDALAELKLHCKLIVLSNVDRKSFAGSSTQLGDPFHSVITAEDVGSYKPAAPNFQALLAHIDELGIDRSAHLHVAQSLFHDHKPAKALGIDTVWINRRQGKSNEGASGPVLDVTPDAEFPDMTSFTAALVEAKS
jgi:2-haloacid dehalogenase